MYCTYCGKQNHQPDGRFCSYCGKMLASDPLLEEEGEQEAAAAGVRMEESLPHFAEQLAASLSHTVRSEPDNEAFDELETVLLHVDDEEEQAEVLSRGRGGIRIYTWLVPVLLAMLVGAGVYGYYSYELLQNERVTSWQNEAKRQALHGSYEQSAQLLDKAISARPKLAALQADRAIVQEAADMARKLSSAENMLKDNKLDETNQLLAEVSQTLNKREEELFEPLRSSLKEQQAELTVQQIKSELDQIDSVKELISKLRVADGLANEESAAVHEQIVARIGELSIQEGERLLERKSFNDAASAVDIGLEYDSGNEKLQSLKDKIASDKKAYEEAEQNRIKLAQQKAAEEDLKNRTAAVEVEGLTSTLDENGDVHIHAKLRNIATKTIYSVYVEYTLLDEAGSVINTGTIYATPDQVEPGETAVVDDIYYNAYQKAQVRIDRAGWFLE
ncbi:hypothetical protein PCCS19_25800 [Paenibacillus sp. CCS19]|uniref:FxLYD domain-containing protein n=1 Tax=Paenibacillus sp. CCS19 TaxID=3158387 RepID=UPI00256E8A1A|nr:FxLYD domain-containing protein [Paenibacillus cellulosilyticus]GMK39526.1 hypothetical protein PCCS19_25800 [Paenibacillus cellulosilyticus]